MKLKYLLRLVISIAILLIGGCESTHDNNSSNQFGGKVSYFSDCKGTDANTIVEFDKSVSAVIYEYSKDKKILYVKHINTAFNCCPGELDAIFKLDGKQINIYEEEEASMCKCNCLYDIYMEITGINPDIYNIYIYEPYLGNQKGFDFPINLKAKERDTIIIERTFYPWGN